MMLIDHRLSPGRCDGFQLPVVRVPAPRSTAAESPFITLPGAHARVFADGLLQIRVYGFLGIEQQPLVGTGAVCSPHELAGVDVECTQITEHAELAAGYADDNLVFDDHRRSRDGLALERGSVVGGPDHLAGLRVECIDVTVE